MFWTFVAAILIAYAAGLATAMAVFMWIADERPFAQKAPEPSRALAWAEHERVLSMFSQEGRRDE